LDKRIEKMPGFEARCHSEREDEGFQEPNPVSLAGGGGKRYSGRPKGKEHPPTERGAKSDKRGKA